MSSETVFRVAVALILLSALVISGSYRRRARQQSGTIARSEEGGLALALRGLGGLLLFGTFAAYVVAPGVLSFSRLGLPAAARWLGLALGLAMPAFLLWVFRSIGSNISETVLTKETHQLVTSGPYRWIRHPLYAGAMAMIFSIALMADSWLIFAYWLAVVLLFRFVVVPKEEANLQKMFGDSYASYMERTGALLPGPGYVPAENSTERREMDG